MSEGKDNKRKRTLMYILLPITFLLAAGIYEYFIINKYYKEEGVPIKYDSINIDFNNGKALQITAPTSECDDTGYIEVGEKEKKTVIIEEGLAWVLYEDNQNRNCDGSRYSITYIKEEPILSSYFYSGVTFPLKTLTIEGVEYGIIKQDSFDFSETQGKEEGLLLQKYPTITVGDYEAFRIYSYMRIYEKSNEMESLKSDNIFKDSRVETYCVFDLSKIDSSITGYLLFMGDSENYDLALDYCEILDNDKDFKIIVLEKEEL